MIGVVKMPMLNLAVEIVLRVSGSFQRGFQLPASVYTEAQLESSDAEIIDL
jgi:hypothetical protein